MKCLVCSNCATPGYVQNLQAIYPDWDIRGASVDLAEKWVLKEPKQAFIDFMGEADLYVGFDPAEYPFLSFKAEAEQFIIPPFLFRGLHPDVIQLFGGRPSVLGKEGIIYSRLVTVGFMAGLSVDETMSLFTKDVYGRAGYLDAYEPERERVLATFAEVALDLEPLFARWSGEGAFLYHPNHGKKQVYFDITWQFAKTHLGLPSGAEARGEDLRAAAICIFPQPVTWPVYAGIGDPYGIHEPYEWKTSMSAGHETLTLRDFVTRTYEHLADFPSLTPEAVPGYAECRAAILEAPVAAGRAEAMLGQVG